MARGAGCRSGTASFTAAYFDHSGLYCFGRQPEAIHWNCGQLAIALRLLAETEPLVFALDRFGELFGQAMQRRFLWRLGVEPRGADADFALIAAAEQHMQSTGTGPDALFFAHRGGRNPPDSEFGALLAAYVPLARRRGQPVAARRPPPTLVIEEVERIWAAIDTAR